MIDESQKQDNAITSETPPPGQTFYELLKHRPGAWPHIYEAARLQVAMHAWILLSAHDFAAPDNSHVMDVLWHWPGRTRHAVRGYRASRNFGRGIAVPTLLAALKHWRRPLTACPVLSVLPTSIQPLLFGSGIP